MIEIIKKNNISIEVIKQEPPVFYIDVISSTSKKIEVVNKNVFLTQNRQEGLVIRDVPCDSNVYVGSAVVMNSNGTASLAIATSWDSANVAGIIDSKTSENLCDLRFLGVTDSIFSNFIVTEEYYLSDQIAGKIVPVAQAPTTSGHIRIKLGQPFSSSQFIYIKGERIIKG